MAEDMDKNFDTVAPIIFGYERNTERSRMISRELRKFYLKDQPLTNASLSSLGEVSSPTELLKHVFGSNTKEKMYWVGKFCRQEPRNYIIRILTNIMLIYLHMYFPLRKFIL
jgi:hypothetical protein